MINVRTQVPLAPFTSIGVGGNATEFVEIESEHDIFEALDYSGEILILGGGSNLLISDHGFSGRVIHIATSGINHVAGAVEVAAGESWDEFVAWGLNNGYGQLAPLTGIPGTVGATPIQNVGAYGTEVSDLINQVTVFDRLTKTIRTISCNDCRFSYRNSVFKTEPNRFVVLKVLFGLAKTNKIPVTYDELARKLQISVGEMADAQDVYSAVRLLRASKGMLIDKQDRDTYSVGSFFLNPRIAAEQRINLPKEIPAWQQQDGSWKVSAAWLINEAGFNRGYRKGDAAISSKHTLAICNLGSASSEQIIDLANEIRSGVSTKFGIELQIEPILIK